MSDNNMVEATAVETTVEEKVEEVDYITINVHKVGMSKS